MTCTHSTLRTFMALGLAVTSVAGCETDEAGPLEPTTELTETQIVEALTRTIQDEYHAENIYLRVTADFGAVLPFDNILYAEQRHSAALAQLFANRGLVAPNSIWNLNNVPVFGSTQDACVAAVQAEIENIEIYDEFFLNVLPADVSRVFTSNRRASLDRHLPAFQNCS